MNKSDSQSGSVLIVVIVGIAILVLGGLGYVLWNNFNAKDPVTSSPSVSEPKTFCEDNEDVTAENGVFCSEDIGIKFKVPTIFTNKVEKTANYEVFQSGVNISEKQSAGMSDNVYSVVISGNDNFTFTIAQEPLRTGNIDFPYKMAPTYFNSSNRKLSDINFPTSSYDSKTDTITVQGEYAVGEDVPSFKVGDVPVYKGGYGDAGQLANYYLMIVRDKIVKIVLKHAAYMGPSENDPATIDEAIVFDELDESIKSLIVIQ